MLVTYNQNSKMEALTKKYFSFSLFVTFISFVFSRSIRLEHCTPQELEVIQQVKSIDTFVKHILSFNPAVVAWR